MEPDYELRNLQNQKLNDSKEKDRCLNCRREYESELWGAKCSCEKPNVVHLVNCHGCNHVLGIIVDDDYVGLNKLYCSTCVEFLGE